MRCPACGANNRHDAAFCLTCRATIPASDSTQPFVAQQPAQPAWSTAYVDRPIDQTETAWVFAGFWSRFLAWVLDSFFSVCIAIVPAVIVAVMFAQATGVVTAAVVGFLALYIAIIVAYYTIANATGGGWGKRMLGLRIVRARDGGLPGYGTGFLRAVAPYLIGIVPLVGIVMPLLDDLWMLWDADSQTLHDKISGTYVVRR